MTSPTTLLATWSNGVFVFTGQSSRHELAGHSIAALASDGHGGTLAIVDGHSLCRRAHDGEWSTIATSEFQLACSVAVGDVIYVGTDDARILRVSATGEIDQPGSLDAVPGRETWYAGSALVDGQLVGPPLGIRSITASADGKVLLANVHVGGIPRSTDGGVTWNPTIDVGADVHEVLAHPVDPDIVIAASAAGLCVSRDGGATWAIETEGLHALHCTAVAFSGNDVLVSAAATHFATEGAVYRRPLFEDDALVKVGGGLPPWLDGIVDTSCIGSRASAVAVADRGGNLYLAATAGGAWSRIATALSAPSGVLVV